MGFRGFKKRYRNSPVISLHPHSWVHVQLLFKRSPVSEPYRCVSSGHTHPCLVAVDIAHAIAGLCTLFLPLLFRFFFLLFLLPSPPSRPFLYLVFVFPFKSGIQHMPYAVCSCSLALSPLRMPPSACRLPPASCVSTLLISISANHTAALTHPPHSTPARTI